MRRGLLRHLSHSRFRPNSRTFTFHTPTRSRQHLQQGHRRVRCHLHHDGRLYVGHRLVHFQSANRTSQHRISRRLQAPHPRVHLPFVARHVNRHPPNTLIAHSSRTVYMTTVTRHTNRYFNRPTTTTRNRYQIFQRLVHFRRLNGNGMVNIMNLRVTIDISSNISQLGHHHQHVRLVSRYGTHFLRQRQRTTATGTRHTGAPSNTIRIFTTRHLMVRVRPRLFMRVVIGSRTGITKTPKRQRTRLHIFIKIRLRRASPLGTLSSKQS